MSELQIREIDVHDDADVAAWHEVMVAVDVHELGDHAVLWSLPELIVNLRAPRKDRRNLMFIGELDGRAVAHGSVGLPLLDNTTAADVAVGVLPEVRRQGLGTRMLEHVERVAAENDRTRLDAMVSWPYDGPSDGAGMAGIEFGTAHGYSLGIGDVQREMVLPIGTDIVEQLATEAAPYHPDYEIRAWVGPVPDELVQGWLELSATLITEAPTGDNEYESESTDVEAWRMREKILEEQGRTKYNCVALDREGRVVAYTDLVTLAHDQPWVMQWGTLVHRDHRGHRLGLAVKAANLLQLLRSGAELNGRRLVTWNAEVNSHMIGINERLGFRPTARGGELQKRR
jgi:GNAT superfamily N-acetyltransferase